MHTTHIIFLANKLYSFHSVHGLAGTHTLVTLTCIYTIHPYMHTYIHMLVYVYAHIEIVVTSIVVSFYSSWAITLGSIQSDLDQTSAKRNGI